MSPPRSRPRRGDEDGAAVFVAMVITFVLLLIGLGVVLTVNSQQRAARGERERESSFNLAEAALQAESLYLTGAWPGAPGSALTPCTQAGGARCPASSTVTGVAGNVDFGGAPVWQTEVHDDGGGWSAYYSDDATTGTRAQPGYDANGDDLVWIRAQAVVRGDARTIVARVKRPLTARNFPGNAVTAGSVQVTDNGKKTLIDLGTSSQVGTVAVRCHTAAPSPGDPCLGWDPGKGQANPNSYRTDYPGSPALSPQDLSDLKSTAAARGACFDGGDARCQSRAATCADLAGPLVYIADTGGGLTCTGNGAYNPKTAPGALIVGRGKLGLGGNSVFYGLIYHMNLGSLRDTDIVSTQGNAQIVGAVSVDGPGGVTFGSSGLPNFSFDANAFGKVQGYAPAQIVKGSFREVRAGG